MALHPVAILVFSGKRKSGKDHVTNILKERLTDDRCSIMRLSGPLKGQYAKDHGLDAERLLDASEYKERYRADMIRWGEEMRDKDPSYFCRLATAGEESNRPIWIISDARRLTDVQHFLRDYGDRVIAVRVCASEAVRIDRGWVFTKGVDDAESECGLDSGVDWDWTIHNDGDNGKLEQTLSALCEQLHLKLTAAGLS